MGDRCERCQDRGWVVESLPRTRIVGVSEVDVLGRPLGELVGTIVECPVCADVDGNLARDRYLASRIAS